jgi:hypothetical protein
VVDALNKRVHEMHTETIKMYRTNLKEKIIATTNSYQRYVKIKETLQKGNLQQ